MATKAAEAVSSPNGEYPPLHIENRDFLELRDLSQLFQERGLGRVGYKKGRVLSNGVAAMTDKGMAEIIIWSEGADVELFTQAFEIVRTVRNHYETLDLEPSERKLLLSDFKTSIVGIAARSLR